MNQEIQIRQRSEEYLNKQSRDCGCSGEKKIKCPKCPLPACRKLLRICVGSVFILMENLFLQQMGDSSAYGFPLKPEDNPNNYLVGYVGFSQNTALVSSSGTLNNCQKYLFLQTEDISNTEYFNQNGSRATVIKEFEVILLY